MSESHLMASPVRGHRTTDTGDTSKPSLQSLTRTSRHFTPKAENGDVDDSDLSARELFNASLKHTAACDISDSEGESRVGVINYFNSPKEDWKSRRNNETKRKNEAANDFVIEVESDPGDSPGEFDSPCSGEEAPVSKDFPGTEMKTFRISDPNEVLRENNTRQFDEAHNAASDEEDEEPHRRLYGSRHMGRNMFASMNREDSEDYESITRSRNKQTYSYNTSRTDSKAVDDAIAFLPRNNVKNTSNRPPFGDPPNFEMLKASVGPLLKRSDGFSSYHTQMEIDSDRARDGPDTETNTKKKKKKKKTNKDDGGGDVDSKSTKETFDVNGNPVEASSTSKSKKSGSKGTSAPSEPRSNKHVTSGFPSTVEDVGKYGSMSNGDVDSSNPSSDTSGSKHRKKKKSENVIKASNIPGNRGEEDVDTLLDFIQGPVDGKKGKNKKPQTMLAHNGPTVVSASASEVQDKASRRKRNRNSGSQKDGSENSSEKGEDIVNSVKSASAEPSIKDSVSEVGSVSSDLTSLATHQNADEVEGVASNIVEMLSVTLANEPYIFTDFDSVQMKKEEEFQVVSKVKKYKKQKPSAPIFNNYPMNGFVTRETGTLHIPREERRKPRPVLRSVTPPPAYPPISPVSSVDPLEKVVATERAFSPSAFPALGGRSREGRRNSTGNVPSESAPDDSDMESVKSLPIAGNGVTDGVASPPSGVPSVVSYAKIAAGPKTKGSNNGQAVVKSVSSNSGSVNGECERRLSQASIASDRSTTKSLGENPKDNSLVTISNNEAQAEELNFVSSLQPPKEVCQTSPASTKQTPKACDVTKGAEATPLSVISAEPVVTTPKNTVTGAPDSAIYTSTTVMHISKSAPAEGNNNGQISTDKPKHLVKSKVDKQNDIKHVPLPVVQQQKCNPVSSSTTCVVGVSNKVTSSTETSKSNIKTVESVSNKKEPVPEDSQSKHIQKLPKSSTSSNNRKHKVRSVVFLDQQMDPEHNLGISFGYEPDMVDTYGNDKPPKETSQPPNGPNVKSSSATGLVFCGPVLEGMTPPPTGHVLSGTEWPELGVDNNDKNISNNVKTFSGINGLVQPAQGAVVITSNNNVVAVTSSSSLASSHESAPSPALIHPPPELQHVSQHTELLLANPHNITFICNTSVPPPGMVGLPPPMVAVPPPMMVTMPPPMTAACMPPHFTHPVNMVPQVVPHNMIPQPELSMTEIAPNAPHEVEGREEEVSEEQNNGQPEQIETEEKIISAEEGVTQESSAPNTKDITPIETVEKIAEKPKINLNLERGRFAVEDAAYFLKKEWDKIMDIKEQNPEKVIFYSCP